MAIFGDLGELRAWQMCESAGYSGHFKPYDLCRTLATELISTGIPTHEVRHQLMHRHANTTLDNYAGRADIRGRCKAGRIRHG